MTSIRAMSCIHLVQILNSHMKITLGLPKTVWKIKWWKLHNCHFSFIENEDPPHLPGNVCTLTIAKSSGYLYLMSLSNKPSNYTNKPSGCLNKKCKNSKYHAIQMILTNFKYHNTLLDINPWFVYSIAKLNIYINFEFNLINYTFLFKNLFKINQMLVSP